MNTSICFATLAAAVACLTLTAASPAQAAACSYASLRGKYAPTISGEILLAPGIVQPQNGVAITKFDGEGTFMQEDFVVIGEAPVSSGFATGETGTSARSTPTALGPPLLTTRTVCGSIWSS